MHSAFQSSTRSFTLSFCFGQFRQILWQVLGRIAYLTKQLDTWLNSTVRSHWSFFEATFKNKQSALSEAIEKRISNLISYTHSNTPLQGVIYFGMDSRKMKSLQHSLAKLRPMFISFFSRWKTTHRKLLSSA